MSITVWAGGGHRTELQAGNEATSLREEGSGGRSPMHSIVRSKGQSHMIENSSIPQS